MSSPECIARTARHPVIVTVGGVGMASIRRLLADWAAVVVGILLGVPLGGVIFGLIMFPVVMVTGEIPVVLYVVVGVAMLVAARLLWVRAVRAEVRGFVLGLAIGSSLPIVVEVLRGYTARTGS
jgi:hypothetical protein